MAITAAEFENDLYLNMPITRHMGIRALSFSSEMVYLEAPLAPNLNHNKTGFGGCVFSVAVLSCWALANEAVREAKIDAGYIVVQDSQIEYLEPVTTDFTAESSWATNSACGKFLYTLKRRGLARVAINSVVKCNGFVTARLSARFVAQVPRI